MELEKECGNILENTLGIIITDGRVQAAYETGSTMQRMINGKKTLPKFMLVQCTLEQKKLPKNYVVHLNDKHSENGIKYFIVIQISEAVKEWHRQTNELIREIKEKKLWSM